MKNVTRTTEAVTLYNRGLFKESLRIFKTFKNGNGDMTGDRRILEIAYEMLTGKEVFYRQLGFIKSEIVVHANKIVKERWISRI